VKEGEEVTPEDELSRHIFLMPRPGRPNWSHYRGSDTNYVEPLPLVPVFPPEAYMQAGVEDPPEDDDANYVPMEEDPKLTEDEVSARSGHLQG
jgi:hypothetical protein